MKKKKLGEILIEAGVITPRELSLALQDQKNYGGRLGTILLERRFITEKDYFSALSSQLEIPAVDFTKSTVPEAVTKIVSQELAEKYNVFPVALKRTAQGTYLVLAMGDPTDVRVQDEVRFTTGYKVEPVLALDSTITYVIRDYYYQHGGRGSYRMEVDPESSDDAPGMIERIEVEHSKTFTPDDPELLTAPEEEDHSYDYSPGKPNLNRELKALLKLLAKKGILTPKEYLDIFNETD